MEHGAHISAALDIRHRNALIYSTTLNPQEGNPGEAETAY